MAGEQMNGGFFTKISSLDRSSGSTCGSAVIFFLESLVMM